MTIKTSIAIHNPILMNLSSKQGRLMPGRLTNLFVADLLARHQWDADFDWPLMDLIYLLEAETQQSEQQAVYIKELISHNPIVINALKNTIAQLSRKNPKIEIHPKVYVQYRTAGSVSHNPIMKHNHQQVVKLIKEFQMQENVLPMVTKSEIRQNGRNKNVQAFMKFIHSIANYYHENHKEPKRKPKVKEQEMTKILQDLMVKSPVIQNTYLKQAVDKRINLLSAQMNMPRYLTHHEGKKILFKPVGTEAQVNEPEMPAILMKAIVKDNKAKPTQKIGNWVIQKTLIKLLSGLRRNPSELLHQADANRTEATNQGTPVALQIVKQIPQIKVYKTLKRMSAFGLKKDYLIQNQFSLADSSSPLVHKEEPTGREEEPVNPREFAKEIVKLKVFKAKTDSFAQLVKMIPKVTLPKLQTDLGNDKAQPITEEPLTYAGVSMKALKPLSRGLTRTFADRSFSISPNGSLSRKSILGSVNQSHAKGSGNPLRGLTNVKLGGQTLVAKAYKESSSIKSHYGTPLRAALRQGSSEPLKSLNRPEALTLRNSEGQGSTAKPIGVQWVSPLNPKDKSENFESKETLQLINPSFNLNYSSGLSMKLASENHYWSSGRGKSSQNRLAEVSHQKTELKTEIVKEVLGQLKMEQADKHSKPVFEAQTKPVTSDLPIQQISIDKLADQVYEKVSQRLERERRRRGI